MPRAVLATALLALVVTLLPAAPAQAQTQERYVKQARAVTNDRRADHDLARLRSQGCAQKFARRQARRMARQDRLFHQDLGKVLDRCDLSGVAENVAYGYTTGRRVVRAWMQSPGHRANLLEPSYRMLGMAARRGGTGGWYAVQVFGRR
jgi:uncharacterized protein YkwD